MVVFSVLNTFILIAILSIVSFAFFYVVGLVVNFVSEKRARKAYFKKQWDKKMATVVEEYKQQERERTWDK